MVMQDSCSLACFPGLLRVFLLEQGHLPRGGTAHHGLDPRTSLSNQDNAQTCLQDDLIDAIPQLRFFLPSYV